MPLASRARDQGNRNGSLLQSRVGRHDLRVVPLGDFAQEDAAVRFARQLQVVLEFREVVGQHDRPGSHRDELDAPANLGDFRVGHGRVAGAEVDEVLFGEVRALADEAFDARPAAHRIIGDGQFWMLLLVRAEPCS